MGIHPQRQPAAAPKVHRGLKLSERLDPRLLIGFVLTHQSVDLFADETADGGERLAARTFALRMVAASSRTVRFCCIERGFLRRRSVSRR
jgi:hypothetical protein